MQTQLDHFGSDLSPEIELVNIHAPQLKIWMLLLPIYWYETIEVDSEQGADSEAIIY